MFVIECGVVFVLGFVSQQVYIFFFFDDGYSGVIGVGCNYDFDELFINNVVGSLFVQWLVKSNDVVKSGGGIGLKCVCICFVNGLVNGNIVGVGVFYNNVGWFVEGFNVFQCGIGICYIVK